MKRISAAFCILILLPTLTYTPAAFALPELRPVVEAEETVYQYTPADNGAGPLWCRGSTSLYRAGVKLFARRLYTLAGVPQLNTCRRLHFPRSS